MTVLVIHLTGSERYWIGDVAVGDPSGRDREAEFHVRGLDAAALQDRLASTLTYSQAALSRLRLEDLASERVSPMDGNTVTVGWALLHALDHIALHTGHIQIMRQLVKERREAWYSFTASDDDL